MRRWGVWIGAVALVVGATLTIAAPARAADDYPYRDADSSELDPRGFYYNHCTSFVAWRMSQRGEFHNYMRDGHWWHARNWAENAQRLGFRVDSAPAPGAIAHWYAGEDGADELGHVAVVESVNADGSVMVEEYNGTSPLAYSRRGPTHAPRYIHVYDVAGTVAAPAPDPQLKPAEVTAPAAVETKREERVGPVGKLTAPASDARLRTGDTVTVSGDFTDDTRVEKVHFFATDDRYRWTKIGTDAHGGNGTYAVEWKIDYPMGSSLSFYAEAFDHDGNHALDSIRGLEGIDVLAAKVAVAQPAPATSTTGEPVSGMLARASQTIDKRSGGYLPLVAAVGVLIELCVLFSRGVKRLSAKRELSRRFTRFHSAASSS